MMGLVNLRANEMRDFDKELNDIKQNKELKDRLIEKTTVKFFSEIKDLMIFNIKKSLLLNSSTTIDLVLRNTFNEMFGGEVFKDYVYNHTFGSLMGGGNHSGTIFIGMWFVNRNIDTNQLHDLVCKCINENGFNVNYDDRILGK